MKKQPTKKIKVVISISDFLIGGAERLIIDQLKYFNRDKFNLTLITLFKFPHRETFYEFLPKDLKVYKLNFGGFYDLKSWLQLIRILFRLKPNVVVSHLFFSNSVIRILKILFGYKNMVVEHNTYINKKKWQIILDRILSRLTYKIVAVSKTVAAFTAKQEGISVDKFVTIHNGVDLEAIKNTLSNLPPKQELMGKLGFSPSGKIFINVARLTSQKNHRLLIKAFSVFLEHNPGYKLIILGDGALRGDLQSLIRELKRENEVLLLGNRTNVIEYYSVSECLVSTSNIEGLSIAYLEAMACGLPLLSTKTAGTDELIRDRENGFFILDRSVDSTIKSMLEFINSNHEKLRENTLKFIKSFDIKKNVRAYEELIKRCIKS